MADIRAALQELHDAVHEQFFGHDTELPPRLIKACNEAGQLLCRTAQPEGEGLTDDDLRGFFYQHCDRSDECIPWLEEKSFLTAARAAIAAEREACAQICDKQYERARTSTGAARADACATAIRALWGRPAPQPEPPAEGEVAELVEMLKGVAYWRRHGKPGGIAPAPFDIRQADRLDRAAELLQRQHPQPVSVSVGERWPEFSDCDSHDDRVWCWNPVLDHWKLSRIKQGVHTHWLPAHALPLPTSEEGE